MADGGSLYIGALTVAQLRSGDSREYHTLFPTAQLPGALTHQVVEGRAVTSSVETAVRPPTRLLRQSVHALPDRTLGARAGQEALHSIVRRTRDWSIEQLTDTGAAFSTGKARCTFNTTGCLVSQQ